MLGISGCRRLVPELVLRSPERFYISSALAILLHICLPLHVEVRLLRWVQRFAILITFVLDGIQPLDICRSRFHAHKCFGVSVLRLLQPFGSVRGALRDVRRNGKGELFDMSHDVRRELARWYAGQLLWRSLLRGCRMCCAIITLERLSLARRPFTSLRAYSLCASKLCNLQLQRL